ncbi:hypothetical protein [Marmoricola sp. RAF53]|uniref:hypothetical protein n=1 Tax=Marmoricola sp. RAF53 TaxID=3233059 RepID=UPI003F95DA99
MPWSPSFGDAVPDPRLDPVRDRAARLEHDAQACGYVLVETDFMAAQLGGVLWWRRWATPQEYAVVLTRLGEETREVAVGNDDLDIVARWAADGFTDGGATYAMVWLDQAESRRVHDEVFAHHH